MPAGGQQLTRSAVILVFALGGCDRLFGLADIKGPDAALPCGIGHDEDGDGVADHCDNCPTLINPLQENTDTGGPDAVGDACDPHLTNNDDKIALFDPFTDATNLAVEGAATVAGDDVQFVGAGSIASLQSVSLPTSVVVSLAGWAPRASEGVQLSAVGGKFTCSVQNAPCLNEPSSGNVACLTLAYTGAAPKTVDLPLASPLTQVTGIMLRDPDSCTVTIDGILKKLSTSTGQGTLMTGTISFSITGGGVTLHNWIAYGK